MDTSPYRRTPRCVGDSSLLDAPSFLDGDETLTHSVQILRAENRNLRMRLMYVDELLAKRGIDADAIHDRIDLQLQLDTARAEAQKLRQQFSESQHKIAFMGQKAEVSEIEQSRVASVVAEYEAAMEKMRSEMEEKLMKYKAAALEAESVWNAEREALQHRYEKQIAESAISSDQLASQIHAKGTSLIEAQGEISDLQRRLRELLADNEHMKFSLDNAETRFSEETQRMLETQRSTLDELQGVQKRIAAETARNLELEKSHAATEAVLAIYKSMFQRLGTEVKSIADNLSTELRDNSTARREDSESGTPAGLTAAVLHSSIEDVLAYVRGAWNRSQHQCHGAILRAFRDTTLAMEDTYGSVATSVRRMTHRVTEAADCAASCAKKRHRFKLSSQSSQREIHKLQELLAASEGNAVHCSRENAFLQDEIRRLSADVASAKMTTIVQDGHAEIERCLSSAVRDIKSYYVNTNILTEDFLTAVREAARRASDFTQSLHDELSVGSHIESPSAEGRSATLEMLVGRLSNIAALLQNNLDQAKESSQRTDYILREWEQRIIEELRRMEQKMKGGGEKMETPRPQSQYASTPQYHPQQQQLTIYRDTDTAVPNLPPMYHSSRLSYPSGVAQPSFAGAHGNVPPSPYGAM